MKPPIFYALRAYVQQAHDFRSVDGTVMIWLV